MSVPLECTYSKAYSCRPASGTAFSRGPCATLEVSVGSRKLFWTSIETFDLQHLPVSVPNPTFTNSIPFLDDLLSNRKNGTLDMLLESWDLASLELELESWVVDSFKRTSAAWSSSSFTLELPLTLFPPPVLFSETLVSLGRI